MSAEERVLTAIRDVTLPLEDIPVDQRHYACRQLLACAQQLEEVKALLRRRPSPAEDTMASQNHLLCAWLSAYVAGVSATPSVVRADLLDHAVCASGVIAPFVAPGPNGALGFGVPTRVTPDLLCDNAAELLRMAAAALVSLFVYLNFVQRQSDLPPDEVVLIFSTIAIQSCGDAANAAAIDAEMAALASGAGGGAAAAADASAANGDPLSSSSSSSAGGDAAPAAPPALTCSQIKWLMHWARSVAMAQMAGAAFLAGDQQERQAECLQCVQKDHQHMVKALPDNPLGYSLYCRSCMTFQQMGAATAFLRRGLDVAAAQGDDHGEVAMAYQLAVALLMGGGGSEVCADEVLALIRRGDAAAASVRAWWPPAWARLARDGDPDRSLLSGRLVAELAKQGDGAELVPGARLKALEGLLYVTRPPDSVTPGALVAG